MRKTYDVIMDSSMDILLYYPTDHDNTPWRMLYRSNGIYAAYPVSTIVVMHELGNLEHVFKHILEEV